MFLDVLGRFWRLHSHRSGAPEPPMKKTRHSAADVRSNALKTACNTLNIIKHCIRHVVIDLWCMFSYLWVADGRILSLKQSLLEINQWFHNDSLLSRHEEHIQCRWCSWENDWAHQIHSPPRYTGACGKCLGCHTKTRDILCLISHCGCQFPLPGSTTCWHVSHDFIVFCLDSWNVIFKWHSNQ